MKALFLVLAALALAGCAPHKVGPKTYPAYVPEPLDMSAYTAGDRHDVDPAPSAVSWAYSTAIGRTIHAGLKNPTQYAGQRCTLRITVDADGAPVSMRTEGGNAAYCQALLVAARAAKFPPRPQHITADVMPLDFKETAPRVMSGE